MNHNFKVGDEVSFDLNGEGKLVTGTVIHILPEETVKIRGRKCGFDTRALIYLHDGLDSPDFPSQVVMAFWTLTRV